MTMTLDELRLWQMGNQHLLSPVDMRVAARDLCGVQAQFLGNAIHALRIRSHAFTEDEARAYLVKNWTVRGSVHVFDRDDLPLFKHCGNGQEYRSNDWRGYTLSGRPDHWTLTPERQAYFVDLILGALQGGERTREELKSLCRAQGMTEAEESCMFESWGGGIREMCERGFIHYVVQEKKAFCLSPPFTPIPEEAAALEIARRYFTHMGPATVHDAMYYFHATAAQVKKWLALLPVSTVECEGRTYYYIENGQVRGEAMPECVFLAGFDQLLLAHEKKESLFLRPENVRAIFNLAGIVMPALLLNGEVAGRWKKSGRKLTVTMFRTPAMRERDGIAAAAVALWDDGVKVQFAE